MDQKLYIDTTGYFIDPSSTKSNLELGTKDFPFKAIDDPFRELFNSADGTIRKVNIFLKHGSNLTIHGIEMRNIAIYMNVSIFPYYDNFTQEQEAIDKQILTKITVYTSNYWRPPSNFNPTLYSLVKISTPYAYNYASLLKLNLLTSSMVTNLYNQFNTYYANFAIERFSFIQITGSYADQHTLFQPFSSPYRWLNITNCYFKIENNLLIARNAANTKIQNATIDFSTIRKVLDFKAAIDCKIASSEGYANNLILDNIKMFGIQATGNWNPFYLESMVNLTMTNILFYNFQRVQTGQAINLYHYPYSCSFKPVTHILLENITIINEDAARQSGVAFWFSMSNTGSQLVTLKNMHFQNVLYTDIAFFQLDRTSSDVSVQPWGVDFKVQIQNISFENVTVFADIAPLFLTNVAFIEFSNLAIKNSRIATALEMSSASSSSLKNMKFQDFQQIETDLSYPLISVTQSTGLVIDQVKVKEITLLGSSAILIQNSQSIQVSNIKYENITDCLNTKIFDFQMIKELNLANFTINNITSSPQSKELVFLNFKNIFDWSYSTYGYKNMSMAVKNVSLSSSDIQFLRLESVQQTDSISTDFANQVSLSISQIKLYNNSIDNKFNFIETKSFVFKKFQILIDRVEAQNLTMEQGALISLSHNSAFNTILNSNFTSNTGFVLLMTPFDIIATDNPLNVIMRNCRFSSNYGQQYSIMQVTQNSQVQVYNSNITENFSQGRGAVIFVEQINAVAYFDSCYLIGNYANYGGVGFSQLQGSLVFNNSYFTKNNALVGGVLYSQNDGQLILINSLMYFNFAAKNSLIFIINSNTMSSIQNVTFTTNGGSVMPTELYLAKVTASKCLYTSWDLSVLSPLSWFQVLLKYYDIRFVRFIFDQCQIASNIRLVTADGDFYNVNLVKASLFIGNGTTLQQQTRFLNSQAGSKVMIQGMNVKDTVDSQYLLFDFQQSEIDLVDVQIQNTSLSMPVFKIELYSTFTVSGVEIKDSILSAFQIIDSKGSLEDSYFKNITQISKTISIINLKNVEASINNVSIDKVYQQASPMPIIYLDRAQVNLSASTIINFETVAIYSDLSSVSVSSSSFQSSSISSQGVGIHLVNSNARISYSSFKSLKTSNKGGAIYAYSSTYKSQKNLTIQVQDSEFEDCSTSSLGGGLYLENYNAFLKGNTFTSNQAEQGGAIYFSCSSTNILKCQMYLLSNSFTNNFAEIQGGGIYYDLYSPIGLISNNFSSNYAQYGSDIGSYPVKVKLINSDQGGQNKFTYASGQMNTDRVIKVGVFDQNDQLINSDSSSNGVLTTEDLQLQISGENKVQAVEGVYEFSSLQFIDVPNTNNTLIVKSDIIDQQKYMLVTGQTYQGILVYLSKQLLDLALEIYLRDCFSGEISQQNQCIKCSRGTYSFSNHSTKCQKCFNYATCEGGNVTVVDQGYWRYSNLTPQIYECPYSDSCLGGINSECLTGYEGKLCNTCSKNVSGKVFARSGNSQCVECEDQTIQILQFVGIFILLVAYLAYLLYQNFSNTTRMKPQTVLVRILTNYIQSIMMVRNFNLFWPELIRKLLDGFSFLSSANEKVFSIDCFTRGTSEFSINLYYLKVITFGMLPVILTSFAVVVWIFIYTIMRMRNHKNKIIYTYQDFKVKIQVTSQIIIFICYPNITNLAFDMFSCQDLGDLGSFLKRDYSIQCYTKEHYFSMVTIAVPIIVVWVFVFPVTIFYRIRQQRKQLNERIVIQKYGFFYVGLTDQMYFWEILVVNSRKIIFIMCSSILIGMSVTVRAMMGIIIIFTLLQVINYKYPYVDPSFNRIEQYSQYAAILCLYGGLFFTEEQVQQNQTILTLLFIAILAGNVYFFVIWGHKFVEVLVRMHYKKLSHFKCLLKYVMKINIEDYQKSLAKSIEKHNSEKHSRSQGGDSFMTSVRDRSNSKKKNTESNRADQNNKDSSAKQISLGSFSQNIDHTNSHIIKTQTVKGSTNELVQGIMAASNFHIKNELDSKLVKKSSFNKMHNKKRTNQGRNRGKDIQLQETAQQYFEHEMGHEDANDSINMSIIDMHTHKTVFLAKENNAHLNDLNINNISIIDGDNSGFGQDTDEETKQNGFKLDRQNKGSMHSSNKLTQVKSKQSGAIKLGRVLSFFDNIGGKGKEKGKKSVHYQSKLSSSALSKTNAPLSNTYLDENTISQAVQDQSYNSNNLQDNSMNCDKKTNNHKRVSYLKEQEDLFKIGQEDQGEGQIRTFKKLEEKIKQLEKQVDTLKGQKGGKVLKKKPRKGKQIGKDSNQEDIFDSLGIAFDDQRRKQFK